MKLAVILETEFGHGGFNTSVVTVPPFLLTRFARRLVDKTIEEHRYGDPVREIHVVVTEGRLKDSHLACWRSELSRSDEQKEAEERLEPIRKALEAVFNSPEVQEMLQAMHDREHNHDQEAGDSDGRD